MQRDISNINLEKKDFQTKIELLQNELNKQNEDINNINNNNSEKIKNNKIEELIGQIESLKDENANLLKEIKKLKDTEILLNQELDDYEKEAKESEIEVNMLKQELKNCKKTYKEGEGKNSHLNTIKENENDNGLEFIKYIKKYVDKIMLKNKFKLYLNMFVSQKIEDVLIENHKLNTEIMELNEKIILLTDLLNNPENIGKYVDEDGNLNLNLHEEQHYEGGENIGFQNNENNENIQYYNNEDIKNENINFENNENINYEEGEEEMNEEYINENDNQGNEDNK